MNLVMRGHVQQPTETQIHNGISHLIAAAREEEIRALSLSVDPANFAHQLYESEGFVKVGESGTSWTMKLTTQK